MTGKSTTAFLTGQSWRVMKSWYTGGGPTEGFRLGITLTIFRGTRPCGLFLDIYQSVSLYSLLGIHA